MHLICITTVCKFIDYFWTQLYFSFVGDIEQKKNYNRRLVVYPGQTNPSLAWKKANVFKINGDDDDDDRAVSNKDDLHLEHKLIWGLILKNLW